MGDGKKTFFISRTEKGVKGQTGLEKKKFINKDSYSAARKAATAIFKKIPKKKNTVRFVIENSKTGKKLPYIATRSNKPTTVKIDGEEVVFKSSVVVKSCDIKDIK
jgi:hypothetical protein